MSCNETPSSNLKIGAESPKRKLPASRNNDSEEDGSGNEYTYYEEDTESEPECDCTSWDVDCQTVATRPEKTIIGFHLMPTCSRDPNENSNKKQKIAPEIRRNLLAVGFNSRFRNSWSNNEKFNDEGVELIVDPFKVCVISDFLDNPNLLESLRQEFYEIDWNARSTDLYEFFQSEDLKHLTGFPVATSVYEFLKNDVMKWVAELTGFNLTHISATCSYYGNTDYLLVHDDLRGDRMVAFVLYFTGKSGWDSGRGGALQLLDRDEDGQPLRVARDVFPANNQLVLFPVTNASYHQVAEVTSLGHCRCSINGWFHTKTPPKFETSRLARSLEGLYGAKQIKSCDIDIDLKAWVNEDYLNCIIYKQIQEYFEENSEICIKKFFRPECFNEISQTLQNEDLKWVRKGPPNRYSYEIICDDNLPQVLDRFLKLFQSNQMFWLLQRFTDLDLSGEQASMKYELQRWTPGCYSLLTDYDWLEKKELDVVIHFGCKNNSDVIGARTLYVAIDEEIQSAFITLEPEENNLNLVYRDTARLTKYFSKQSKCECFYTLICSYSE